MLEIKNISKSYNRQGKDFFAVKDVNLNILDGDFVHIIGRSGSGKSTLLNIVAGLLSADNGTLSLDGTNYLELNGRDISFPIRTVVYPKRPDIDNPLNLVFNDYGLAITKDRTIIENIDVNLANILNKMGAKIIGAGTENIRIEGVDHLEGTIHSIIPDRIEAGTYLSIAAAVGEGVRVKNVIFEHLESLIAKMNEMGVKMEVGEDDIYVFPTNELKAVNIKTMPYPGFATDLQQTITPLFMKANGTAMIVDTIYPKRVGHVPELNRMGAHGKVIEDIITFEGPTPLVGAEVAASDLRAGAGLVVAGLMAEGTTKISNIEHILRGYSNIVEKLQALGADITMIEE